MLRDLSAGAKPHSVVLTRMLQEFNQPHRLGWAANQPVVKIDRHHLRMLGALFVKEIETVHHVARKPVGRPKPRVAVEAIVIGLIRGWNHEMAALAEPDPEGQLVAEIVPVIQEAAVLDQQTPRIVAWSTIEPAHRRLPRKPLDAGDREANMLALGLLIDFEIVGPPVAVTDNLMAVGDEGLRQLGTLLKRPDDAANADLDLETLEDAQQ